MVRTVTGTSTYAVGRFADQTDPMRKVENAFHVGGKRPFVENRFRSPPFFQIFSRHFSGILAVKLGKIHNQ